MQKHKNKTQERKCKKEKNTVQIGKKTYKN